MDLENVPPRLVVTTALACLLVTATATAAEPQPRIIGGEEARSAAWPSTVALVRNTDDSLYQRQFCGGNLVAERWVLTAAHCLHDNDGVTADVSTIKVASGVTDLSQTAGVTEHVISNMYLHPLYNPADAASYNDIALLELAQPAAQPVMALYDGDTDALSGTDTVVVGWGALAYSNFGQLPFPSVLNQVTVPLVSRAVCNQPESYGGLIIDSQICAGFSEGEKDSCVGDSGGPLMLQHQGEYLQVGIVSFGRGCAEPDQYGIYTRVPSYLTWVHELTGTAGSAEPETPQTDPDAIPETPVADRTITTSVGAGGQLALLMLGLHLMRRRDS